MKTVAPRLVGLSAMVGLLGLTTLVALLPPAVAEQGFVTAVKPYVASLVPRYSIKPLLSVGDRVPEISDPSREYQMVGIPDGMGAHSNHDGTITLYMNHEFGNTAVSETVPGVERNRGAIVSKYILAPDGSVLAGERAYDTVFMENTLIGPAAEVGNSTPGFGRFCSGSLAGPEEGFSTYIYFTNEESDGATTFDGKGGLSVAIIDNAAYGLPKAGRFAKENTLAISFPRNKTVVMGMEDGPSSPDSQLYMYVGHKDRGPSATILGRDGLDNGKLHVFVSDTSGMNSEVAFQSGTIKGHWVEILNAETLTDVELEAAADALGAFGFIHPEDGAFNKHSRKDFYFVTTGGGAGNMLGRLYHLKLNPRDPTKKSKLTIVYNADQVIAAGGDIAISPDNIDTSNRYLMINEDGTAESRTVMASKGRDGSVWRFKIKKNGKIDVNSATRVASLNPPGRDGVAVGPGTWEITGVLDSSHLYDKGTWLMNVQAHPPTAAPVADTVEDGQLVLMNRPPAYDHKDDDEDDDEDDEREDD